MVKKNTFLGYYDWINYANAMNDEQLGILFRKILQHVNQEDEDELPLELKIVRADIQTKLDVNAEKRNNKVEETRKKRSEA